MGGDSAIAWAAAIRSPSVTLSTMPNATASAAETVPPLANRRNASAAPIRRGNVCVAPAIGKRPTSTSRRPKRRSVLATRPCAARAISAPAPSAGPCRAAITGQGADRIARAMPPGVWVPAGQALPRSARSMPPENPCPAARNPLARMTARVAGSASTFCSAAIRAVHKAGPNRFPGGANSHNTCTPSACNSALTRPELATTHPF